MRIMRVSEPFSDLDRSYEGTGLAPPPGRLSGTHCLVLESDDEVTRSRTNSTAFFRAASSSARFHQSRLCLPLFRPIGSRRSRVSSGRKDTACGTDSHL